MRRKIRDNSPAMKKYPEAIKLRTGKHTYENGR